MLNLMMDLQDQRGLTYIFITHNLSVVKHISDEIAVMYLGQMVEKSASDEMFENPLHPYTKALLKAIPVAALGYNCLLYTSCLKERLTMPTLPTIFIPCSIQTATIMYSYTVQRSWMNAFGQRIPPAMRSSSEKRWRYTLSKCVHPTPLYCIGIHYSSRQMCIRDRLIGS